MQYCPNYLSVNYVFLLFYETHQHFYICHYCLPVGRTGLQDASLHLRWLRTLALAVWKSGDGARELQEDLALDFPLPVALATRHGAGTPVLGDEAIRRKEQQFNELRHNVIGHRGDHRVSMFWNATTIQVCNHYEVHFILV